MRSMDIGTTTPAAGRCLLPASPTSETASNELKTMRDKGLITEDEYQAKRRQILDQM
jgi:putative oligomerization/nucleic acid binding protein